MSSVLFNRQSLRSLWTELDPLLALHYRELAHYQDIPLAVNKEGYEAMEAAGMVRMFTMRAAGRLVGYACFFVRSNLHYSTSKQAVQDVLWIASEKRGNGDGLQFIEFCDEQLAAEGVQAVYHHVKRDHPALGHALQHLGYEHIDSIYGKRLDKHGSLSSGGDSSGSG